MMMPRLGDVSKVACPTNFKWSSTMPRMLVGRISALADDGEHGAFLEVDLEYPKEILDLHNVPREDASAQKWAE